YADAAKNGLTPSLRALSTMILVSVLLLLVIVNIFSHREKKSKNNDPLVKKETRGKAQRISMLKAKP
uniref:hypothetical protein n=1 Tax=uncultured Dubosiella sp. TaxID=1937011 RepID=UPI00272D0C77